MTMLKTGYHITQVEAGCDEAGRGCLAGPVFAAAVILSKRYKNAELNDSKKLNHTTRNALRTIIERDALATAVIAVHPEEIDRINILRASIRAMHRAIDALSIRPDHLLIDGNFFEIKFRRFRKAQPPKTITIVVQYHRRKRPVFYRADAPVWVVESSVGVFAKPDKQRNCVN